MPFRSLCAPVFDDFAAEDSLLRKL